MKLRKEPSGCWIWLGATVNGQPVVKIAGRHEKVRRRQWPRRRGAVPVRIGTRCGESLCVRPAHLVAVWSGRKPRPGPAPDEIVMFMQENPKGHIECMRRFHLSRIDLLEILESYFFAQPRTDIPSQTAPRRDSREQDDGKPGPLESALAQLVESPKELW